MSYLVRHECPYLRGESYELKSACLLLAAGPFDDSMGSVCVSNTNEKARINKMISNYCQDH